MNRDIRLPPIHEAFLRAAYCMAEKRDSNGVAPSEVRVELGLDEHQGDEVLESLVDAGLVIWPSKGELMLTDLGQRKAEELNARPDIG